MRKEDLLIFLSYHVYVLGYVEGPCRFRKVSVPLNLVYYCLRSSGDLRSHFYTNISFYVNIHILINLS